MSDFTEPHPDINLDEPADGVVDLNFMDASSKELGYDASKEPGQRSVTPPEGAYRFRFELSKKEGDDDLNERTKLPNRWKPGVTKPNKRGERSSYIGTSIKAVMLMPAPASKLNPKPLSLEDFDDLGLVNRQFFCYVSNLFMYGRSSLTDWLNSVMPEKIAEDAAPRLMIQVAEELLQGVPEGLALVSWSLQWKDESEEDTKKQFKNVSDLSDGYKAKFKDGTRAKAWPKDEGGKPKTSWMINLTKDREALPDDAEEDEKITVFARAEVRTFLPFSHEE